MSTFTLQRTWLVDDERTNKVSLKIYGFSCQRYENSIRLKKIYYRVLWAYKCDLQSSIAIYRRHRLNLNGSGVLITARICTQIIETVHEISLSNYIILEWRLNVRELLLAPLSFWHLPLKGNLFYGWFRGECPSSVQSFLIFRLRNISVSALLHLRIWIKAATSIIQFLRSVR